MGRRKVNSHKLTHQMQIRKSNETHLLNEQDLGNFPSCYRPKSKAVAQGAFPKCELQQSTIFPTRRYCPGCLKYNNTMNSAKSANARKIRNREEDTNTTQSHLVDEDSTTTQSHLCIEDTTTMQSPLNDVIISDTLESIQAEAIQEVESIQAEAIQEVKDSLLLENDRLERKISRLEKMTAVHLDEKDKKISSNTLVTRKVLDDRVREFSFKLIKENEALKQDLSQSQATAQHHQITISQINSRVTFLQDQVSSLTFFYAQEALAHNETKQLLQQQQQPQQQQQEQQQQPPQQQALPQQQHEDPLEML